MKKYILVISVIFSMAAFSLFSETQEGNASWYGGRFHGRQTASGEIFDTNKLTAAHKELPFGTIVNVTNLNNGKRVEVRINDRGPFVEGRIIDVSKAAATKLDMLNDGVIPVKISWNTKEKDEGKKEKYSSDKQSLNDGKYTIQVGAFRDFKNVLKLKEKLRGIGIQPYTTMNNAGLIRVLIKDVPADSTFNLVQDLKKIGIESITVKQNG